MSKGCYITITPSSVSGLIGWMDAADLSTIVSSGVDLVSCANKATASIPFVGAGVNKPRTGTRKLNNLNVFDFDGETTGISGNAIASYFTGSDIPFTILAVCVFDNEDSPTNTVWGFARSSSTNPYNYCAYTSSQIQIKRQDDSSSSVQTNYSFALNNDNANAAVFSGTTISAYWNDQVCYSNSACNVGTLTLDTFTIGALSSNGSLSNFWDGSIAEVLIYNRAISASELTSLQRYLGNKWRIPVP